MASGDSGRAAVVLVSGGLDSTVAASIALRTHGRVHALTIDYGQRNRRELDHAEQVCRTLEIDQQVVEVDLTRWGGSSLTGDVSLADRRNNYVPGRNIVFVSLALAMAEAMAASSVYLGFSVSDREHRDTSPGFVAAMQAVSDRAQRCAAEGEPISLRTPLAGMTKPQIITAGLRAGAPLHLTWTCYDATTDPCQACTACSLRRRAFKHLGVPDPAVEAPLSADTVSKVPGESMAGSPVAGGR